MAPALDCWEKQIESNGAALFPREFDSTSLADVDEIELIIPTHRMIW